MKGVILAGGVGTRLFPLTKVTNKHLLPVGREPMIYNPIQRMVNAGIKEIMVITSTQHMGDIVGLLGSGQELGCEFTYRVQEEPKGIAHALALAETFASGEKIFVILGDNVTTADLGEQVAAFEAQEQGARVLLKQVKDPERYGVAAIDEKQVVQIEEKPDKPKSDYAVIGYYFYDHKVFDIIRTLEPSARGELEVTSLNNRYIDLGELTYGVLEGDWTDAGTFESWQYANKILMPPEDA
ncbi:MAG: NTP transferase domain-containing protein [Deltaproteobacteria bacterium]|jgi:glucose-1-phosphate thymidylyltransferase|nr:NTP transferase domain-containing protein [Deltaproteobacteria bacterium]